MTDIDVLQRLQDLVDYPHEDLNIEIKGWLDLTDALQKANLAKAMLATANHCGGFIIVGFTRTNGNIIDDQPRPNSLGQYNDDYINGIVAQYAEPPFNCSVHLIARTSDKLLFPVVVVPGSHRVPIRARRDDPERRHVRVNDYYIRRPGPSSDTPRSGQEWDALIQKCVRSAREDYLDDIRDIIYTALGAAIPEDALASLLTVLGAGTPREPEPGPREELTSWGASSMEQWTSLVTATPNASSAYSHGFWTASYLLPDRRELSLGDLLEHLAAIRGYTGWPPWWVPTRSEIRPRVRSGSIECWLYEVGQDPGHSDYWRASSPARLFLLRGYQEDSPADQPPGPPGSRFDLTLPVWRVGEVLLHAAALAARLGIEDEVLIHFRWTGLAGRRLVAWSSRRLLFEERQSHESEVEAWVAPRAVDIQDRLPELVQQVTRHLYEVFDLFAPPAAMFHEELARMRSRSL